MERAAGRLGWRSALGPAAGFLVAVAGVAGVALAFAYDRGDPHASVAALRGALAWARGLHAWSASAAVLLAVLALADAWMRNRSLARDPRRWGVGLGLLALLLLALLLGGLMPWDQQAWESLRHIEAGTNWLGASWASPDDAPRGTVFWLHVAAVPGAMIALGAWFVARAPGQALREATAGAIRAAVLALPVVGFAALLAMWSPPELGPRPIEGVAVSKPEWPFLWLVPFQDWLGGTWGLFVGASVVGAPLVAAPWIGRTWTPLARRIAAVGFFLALVGLSVAGLD